MKDDDGMMVCIISPLKVIVEQSFFDEGFCSLQPISEALD